MTEVTSITPGASKRSSATSWLNPNVWVFYTDLLAALTAAMLPWSTTGFYILLGFWFLVQVPLMPTRDMRVFLRLLSRPICLWPLAIVLIAVLGTLWADVPWQERLQGIKPAAKLLAIPFLIYHFQESRRGSWVFIAFLASCALLMGLSWIVLFAPALKLATTASAGVPVKNYIDQSQEFALCMVALAPCIATLYKHHRYAAAVACAVLALGFFANMAFVVSARSALIYVPVLLIVFALKYLDHRQSALLFAAIAIAAIAVWFTSPYLRTRVGNIATEYQFYEQNIPVNEAHKQDIPFSTGLRLEYWRKSLRFFADAPVFGNGTGSTKGLFERDAIGKTGLAIEVTKNPHNQTLAAAVQWGMIGIIALYAMWLSHLFLFRGEGFANWIGLLVVVQNIFSSLVNSHLFDFHAGWMYVLGVGTAGGMSLGAKKRAGELPARLPQTGHPTSCAPRHS
ncbi:O-antigen ligase [Bradyrhizobium sp. AUGA SZCCT0182]|uniref:O-antigen ligase family protein n=1 Tax=Bradyrhizobium sp. AUGA SZCCT0182 TaxID=2807667 RepID=UPI001BACE94F|nr:O-antigen ligase family protein [Bradyrhizobium sp. AUGA SZCCT0182]MBR1232040.1 O-antigen ligase family protein [Bradyrhizobium sp. AUGA SZCCT0182]